MVKMITVDRNHVFLSVGRFGALYIPPWAVENSTWWNYIKPSIISKDSDEISWMRVLGLEIWYYYGE